MIRLAYAWMWFHLTLRGPRRLWSRPVQRTDGSWGETWTALALYSFEWAGLWAYKDEPRPVDKDAGKVDF